MKNTAFFKGKKITIVGLARSGLACAVLLHDLGAQVLVTDAKDTDLTRLNAGHLRRKKIKFELGGHSREFISGSELLVISPGVPDSSPAIVMAERAGIPVIGEIEVAAMLCPGTIIAVTGSSGKTTVTTLIGKVLEASGRKAFVCGNIGNPFSGEVSKISAKDFVSLEISSFQLERIKSFKPKVAVILNFSRNHLDRYNDMQGYLAAKKRIFLNQDKNDYLVLNGAENSLKGLDKETGASAVYFSRRGSFNPNQEAVCSVAALFGINDDVCRKVFAAFKGLEHRLEYVAEIDRVKFINDSKATTVESCVWALENVVEPVVLIAGGKDKGVDYRGILEKASGKIKEVVLIGEARPKISAALAGHFPITEFKTLEEAVNSAFNKASPGECVLFSPMCSSFDMFANYEERGKAFKKIVYGLAKKKK